MSKENKPAQDEREVKAMELVQQIKAICNERPTAANGYKLNLWEALQAKIIAALSTPPMGEDQIEVIMALADEYADSPDGQPVTLAENRSALRAAIAAQAK